MKKYQSIDEFCNDFQNIYDEFESEFRNLATTFTYNINQFFDGDFSALDEIVVNSILDAKSKSMTEAIEKIIRELDS